MKKLLCGLLLGWSSCLFSVDEKPADIELVKTIESIKGGYKVAKAKSVDFTYALEERTIARWILPLVIDGAEYARCEPKFIQKSRITKGKDMDQVEEAAYNANDPKFISYNEQARIVDRVVGLIKHVLEQEPVSNQENKESSGQEFKCYCAYFSGILATLKHIDRMVFYNFKEKIQTEFELAHNEALLKAFCFTLEVTFNFYKVYTNEMSDTAAIEAVTELIYEQNTSKKFEKAQYRALIIDSFKGIQSMFNVDNQAIIEFLNEKVLTPDADIWAKLSTGKLGSSLLGGNNRRTPTASPSLQIAKVACGSAAVGTGVYALLETEKGNTLIRWMQKNPKKAGLLATMIAAPLLASVF